jgi:hypothetical protein
MKAIVPNSKTNTMGKMASILRIVRQDIDKRKPGADTLVEATYLLETKIGATQSPLNSRANELARTPSFVLGN